MSDVRYASKLADSTVPPSDAVRGPGLALVAAGAASERQRADKPWHPALDARECAAGPGDEDDEDADSWSNGGDIDPDEDEGYVDGDDDDNDEGDTLWASGNLGLSSR